MGMIGNSLAQGLISGANIQDGTVDTPDIKDSAVTTAKINDSAVTAAKIASAVITPAKLSTGAPTWDANSNVGVGVSLSSWDTTYKAIQVGARSMFFGIGSETNIANNVYYNAGNKYVANSGAGLYRIDANVHKWYNAGSGTAGDAISFSQLMTLDANGYLGVGTAPQAGGNGRIDLLQAASSDSYAGVQVRSFAAGSSDGSTTVPVVRAVNSTAGNWANAKYHAYSHIWGIGGSASSNSAMTLDGVGRLGVGTIPSGWGTTNTSVLQVGAGASLWGYSSDARLGANFFWDGSVYKRINSGYGAFFICDSGAGQIRTLTTTTGSAGSTVSSWTDGPYVANLGTSWSNSSDERLKNITGEIQNGLEKVMTLRAAEFTWKADETATPQVGLIAQDVQAVLPEVISVSVRYESEDTTEYLGVAYDQVTALLVAAIKEQQAIIESLTERITALEGA